MVIEMSFFPTGAIRLWYHFCQWAAPYQKIFFTIGEDAIISEHTFPFYDDSDTAKLRLGESGINKMID
jgi:hypothetical protein